MRKALIMLVLALLFSGCGDGKKPRFTEAELAIMPLPQTTGLPTPSGGYTISVAGETITTKEIVDTYYQYFTKAAQEMEYSEFRKTARPQLQQYVFDKVSNILLYQKARANADDKLDERLKDVVNTEKKRFISSYDGDEIAALEAIRNSGFADWRDYEDFLKRMILSQSYISSQTEKDEDEPVTYDEILAYYNRVKDDVYIVKPSISFRLIDIIPQRLTIEDPNQSPLDAAKFLASQITEKLDNNADFGELAKQYSHGPWGLLGGLWKPINPESIASPYDIIVKETENAAIGDIVGPIEIKGHIFIVKLLEKNQLSAVPFEQVQNEIRRQITLDREKKAYDQIGNKLVNQEAIAHMQDFVDFCLLETYDKCLEQQGTL